MKSSKYKGITYNKRFAKWVATFTEDKVVHKIGYYDTEREAVLATDRYIIMNDIDRPLQILKRKEKNDNE
jgi:hypothetical protein